MSPHQRMPYFVETFSYLQHESTLPRHQSNPTHEIFKDLEGRSNNQIWNYGLKYWSQRHNLFSKFDLGIQTDLEGLYSVTPEALAKHQASRCKGGSTIVDAFTGIGGNAIQFALMGHRVTAIDINPSKIEYAKHNAGIYGVEHLIDFKVGDFFELASTLKKVDVVFLSPPWGGPDYRKLDNYDISMLQPKNGTALFNVARNISQNIMLFVPRNTSVPQLQALSHTCQTHSMLRCEIEHNFIHGGSKGITAYYGQDFVPREKKATDPWRHKDGQDFVPQEKKATDSWRHDSENQQQRGGKSCSKNWRQRGDKSCSKYWGQKGGKSQSEFWDLLS